MSISEIGAEEVIAAELRRYPGKLKLDLTVILAIQEALEKIESGHGSIILEVSQFRFKSIVHAESTLFPQVKKRAS
jgi:hypothetical protein